MNINSILDAYGLEPDEWAYQPFGSGHINHTYRLEHTGSGKKLLLQRINRFVFKDPEAIASNLRKAAAYLDKQHPDYLFIAPISTVNGETLYYDAGGDPWRILPFVAHSYSIDEAEKPEQAYTAASQFARLTQKLAGLDASDLKPAIPDFHNLDLRYRQFEQALTAAPPGRKQEAAAEIGQCKARKELAATYLQLTRHPEIRLRIMHHDTKINNVLFYQDTGEAICPVDLDTLMPGYIFSDLGDMVRTYVSPVSEEEKDLSKVSVRDEFYRALYDGYLSEMAGELTACEKQHLIFAGKMLLYMQTLRFLADYLNGDVYYKTHYPGQNLYRTRNQLTLLFQLEEKEEKHGDIINQLLEKYSRS